MQYSTKRLKHDIQMLNKRLHTNGNNIYQIHHKQRDSIQITTINNNLQFGKSIAVTINETTIIIQPDLPFPAVNLYHVLPHPNAQLIHDLKQIFEKYQNWYFDH